MCRCAGRLAWCPSSELAGRWERDGSKWRNRVAGSWEDATGSISADGQVGTDDTGSAEGRGSCEVLVGVGAKALAIVGGKALDDAGFEEVEAGFGDAANFVGKGLELVREAVEGRCPEAVFEFVAFGCGIADDGSALGAVIGGCRHFDWAAGDDVGEDLGAVIGGEDDVRAFGIVGNHSSDFGASPKVGHAPEAGVNVANRVMPLARA